MRTPAHKEPRKERLEARLTSRQKELLMRAAALRGQSLTDFVVNAASEKAVDVVREEELLVLSRRDQATFAEHLRNPPVANPRLREAVTDYLANEAE